MAGSSELQHALQILNSFISKRPIPPADDTIHGELLILGASEGFLAPSRVGICCTTQPEDEKPQTEEGGGAGRPRQNIA